MAGESGHLLKRVLVEKLAELYAANPDTAQVEVRYSAAGIPDRERVHGGKVACDMEYAAHTGPSARLPREETGTILFYVDVYWAGHDVEETDERARALAEVFEHLVVDWRTWNAPSVQPVPCPDLSWCRISSFDSDSYFTDEGAGSVFEYVVAYKARLN